MSSARFLIFLISLCFFVGCTGHSGKGSGKPQVTVSIPVVGYFIDRIAGDKINVNVMIPQSVGHSDYVPLPSQMIDVANSQVYFAIGNLDFEIAWKNRICDANANMEWVDLSENINVVSSTDDHHPGGTDPHYWMSPQRAKQLCANILRKVKQLLPSDIQLVDSAFAALCTDIDSLDAGFRALAREKGQLSFLIYHPALTYLAEDYGFRQFEIEHEGSAPSPQTYIEEIEHSRATGARVVFVQQGYDMQKAQTAAESIGARVVQISPESPDWIVTMTLILKALRQ